MKKKIIPFDLETAKKIQAGEIEGRIVTEDGKPARILAFDLKSKYYPLAVAYEEDSTESVSSFAESGEKWSGTKCLIIELPYEAPKQYPYDRVKDKITDTDWQEAKKTFPDSWNMQSAFISGVAHQICKEIDNKEEAPRHEFKPFDKVLVRNGKDCIWHPSIFSYQLRDCYYTVGGYMYKKENIIQYEGNEHLIGKTDKPEED